MALGLFDKNFFAPKKKPDKKEKEEIVFNPLEIIRDKRKREQVLTTFQEIKSRIGVLSEEEINEWENFFKTCDFQDLDEVLSVLSAFIGILKEKKVLGVAGQLKNIGKILDNINKIDGFLAEKGIDLKLAA